MLISTHVLVGTALGRAVAALRPGPPGPLLVGVTALGGVVSHLACDALPHGGAAESSDPARPRTVRDARFLAVAVPDGLAGLALLGTAVGRERGARRVLVTAAALGACLPDADKVGELFVGRSPWPRWFDRFHGAIQRESPRRLPGDVAVAAALAALLLGRRVA